MVLADGADLVVWDFDGTLADTQGDVWGSLRYAAGRMGRRFSAGFEDDDEHLALPMGQIMAALEPPVDPADLGVFERDVRVHYRSISAHPHTRLFPGIEALLRALRARGAQCRIATNKPVAALERLLALKGWGDLFDGWVTSDMGEGGRDLDKAQMVRMTLARAGVEAGRAVMVGDSWGDVRGAREAGVASVGVTYGDGDTARLLAEGPDCVADDVNQLTVLLIGEQA